MKISRTTWAHPGGVLGYHVLRPIVADLGISVWGGDKCPLGCQFGKLSRVELKEGVDWANF